MKLLVSAFLMISALASFAHAESSFEFDNNNNYNSQQMSVPTQTLSEEEKLMVEKPYEAPVGKLFDEEAYLNGELAINQFVNVAVVNKKARGPGAQTVRFYTNRQLILETKVSTGREDVEIVGTFTGLFRKVFNTKGTSTSHWRHTLRGFYPVTRVYDQTYRSGESNFQMPYAVFFNDENGLALHQVPPDLAGGEEAAIAKLGTRASSGCVRVHETPMIQINQAVLAADKGQVPVIDSKTGQQKVDKYGQPKIGRAHV